MNANQENKVSMYFKVRLFFGTNLATLAVPVPAFTNVVNTFNTKLDQLGTLDQMATESNEGYAIQKQVNRNDMRDKALAVANGIKSMALINADFTLASKAETSKSQLDKMRDVDVLYWCENLNTLAVANAAAIIPMGITAAKLTAYTAAVTKFKTSIQAPADQRGESASAGMGVDAKIAEIDTQLDILDSLMETQKIDLPLLYNKYQADRAIDNNAASNSPADVTMDLAPGFTSLYNVPYNSGRSFRLRNNGADAINYGLSADKNSFTGTLHNLMGKTETNKLSSNIGDKGDFFVVENPNANTITADLWITE
jgi:hypothetical protein